MGAEGRRVVSHAGALLLSDLAEASTLTRRLCEALAPQSAVQNAHDPAPVLADLAVTIADAAEHTNDIAPG